MKRVAKQIIKSQDLSAEDKVNKLLEMIIDELNPLFKAVSDEELVSSEETYGVYSRTFQNKETKEIKKLTWQVIYGSPEAVRTKFLPC